MSLSQEKVLYVTDLDGTLMQNDKTVSEFTVNTLNKLIDKGMLITYATARSFQSAWRITKDIKFNVPVITRNGTTFADQIQNKEIEIAQFTDNEVATLKDLLRGIIDKVGFVTTYFDQQMTKHYLKGEIGPGFQKYITAHADDKRMYALDTFDNLFEGKVAYITLIATKEELEPVYEKIKNAGEWETIFQKDTYSSDFWLEICPKNATKAKAVLKCKEKLGCTKVVVFGDSTNDLSMFQIADEAYAVENGIPEIKAAATKVIPSNEDDGVARYLLSQI